MQTIADGTRVYFHYLGVRVYGHIVSRRLPGVYTVRIDNGELYELGMRLLYRADLPNLSPQRITGP